MRILRAASALAAAVALGLSGVGAANATDPASRTPLPVPYSFLTGAAMAAGQSGAELPGANDWGCRPSPAKPRPVVLVHGTAGGAVTNWATYGPLLHNEGFCVFTLTYGALPGQPWPISKLGGLSDITGVSVPQVGEFIDRVLAATGAEQVDLVGHSQGTLVSGLVAKVGRPGKVNTVASLAPLWEGSGAGMRRSLDDFPAISDQLARIPSLAQMAPGSEVIQLLWSGGSPYAPGVNYLNVVSRYDQLVVPFTSRLAEGPRTTNVVVQDGCEQDRSDHMAIASDPRAADFVLNALDPANPRVPRCEAIVAYLGPIPTLPGS